MKPYLLALAVGLLVGLIYGLVHVRSPAPPVVALVGLLGILLGEQIVPLAQRLMSKQPVTAAWTRQQCGEHVLGQLPCAFNRQQAAAALPQSSAPHGHR